MGGASSSNTVGGLKVDEVAEYGAVRTEKEPSRCRTGQDAAAPAAEPNLETTP